MAATPSWQRHTSPFLCLVTAEDEDTCYESRVFLHSLRRLGSRDKAFVPTYLPVEVGEGAYLSENFGAEIDRPLSPLILCDGRLILCSRTNAGQVVATVLPVPAAHAVDDVIEPRSAFLLQELGEDETYLVDFEFGFCPMSGRMVLPIESDTSLRITDFLLPLH